MIKARFKKIHFSKNHELPQVVKDMIEDGTLIKIQDDGIYDDDFDTYIANSNSEVKLIENIRYHVVINGKLISLFHFPITSPFMVSIEPYKED